MAGPVVAVAHFPPPVHGMAAAVDRLAAAIERTTPVRRVTISAPGLDRSLSYHRVRVGRVLRALGVLLAERRRSRTALFSCDAGTGMLYTLVLLTWARVLGYRLHLQHHSYAYLDSPSRVFALLVLVGGTVCEHLVTCPRMRRDLLARHPRAHVRVVGIATDLDVAETRSSDEHHEGGLVLGFFGNVTVEKGIDTAVETVRRARHEGLPVSLEVAGPVVDAEAARLLAEAASDLGDALVCHGPRYGADRVAFLDGLDGFLFPSRYAHESFGLAAWEAMARGVPLLACRSGCLTADAVGAGGTVVERNDDFAARAVDVLRQWCEDPDERALAVAGALDAARHAALVSASQTDRFCRDLADVGVTGREDCEEPS